MGWGGWGRLLIGPEKDWDMTLSTGQWSPCLGSWVSIFYHHVSSGVTGLVRGTFSVGAGVNGAIREDFQGVTGRRWEEPLGVIAEGHMVSWGRGGGNR